MTYTVSALSAASPDLSDEEFQRLVDDIREHGQLVPIWVSGEEVIDGRKRLRACSVLGIEPKVVNVSAGQRPEVITYSLNILRTHYTPSQRAMFAAKRATLGRGENLRRAERNSKGQVTKFGHLGLSVDEAGKEAAVARGAVVAAKALRRDAAPEVVTAVESGKLTLHAAQQIVAAVPKAEQPAAVEQVIQASTGKARQTPARVLRPTASYKASPKRELAQRMANALDALETTVGFLHRFVDEPSGFSAAWISRLRDARTALSRIIAKAERGSA